MAAPQTAGTLGGAIGQLVVIVGETPRYRLGADVIHRLGEDAHLRRAVESVLRIVDGICRHSRAPLVPVTGGSAIALQP